MKRMIAAALSAWALSSVASADTSAASEALTGKTCEVPADSAREASDQRLVDAAMRDFQHAGYDALAQHLDDLRNVLDHAPACYPLIERRGEDIIVRDDMADQTTMLALTTTAATQQRHAAIRSAENVYGSASLLVGSYSNEMHRFDDAVSAIDRGLALQPSNQYLVLEKATALGQLRRFDEQVGLLQAELDSPDAALTLDRARFERNLGAALIDLDRLDEAEAALNESIRLQPDNPAARNELRYLAQVRAGRVPTMQTITRAQPDPPPKH